LAHLKVCGLISSTTRFYFNILLNVDTFFMKYFYFFNGLESGDPKLYL